MQLEEMSQNDLSDYERNVDITRSRKRHDTITVENEDKLNELEWTSSRGEGSDNSFAVEFAADPFQRSTGNNNGMKIDDSSGIVFQHVSIV